MNRSRRITRRPNLQRPFVTFGLRLGPQMLWDPDPPAGGGDQVGGGDAPPPADPPADKTYTKEELQQRLRGSGKKIDELEQRLADFEAKEAKRAEEAQKRKQDEAAKRGEFEKLFDEEKAKAASLEGRLSEEAKRRESLEALLKGELDDQLKSVEDADQRKRWEQLLDGRPVLEQRSLLTELIAASGRAPAPRVPQGGPPGKPKPPTPDEIRSDPAKRREYAAQFLASKRGGQ